MNVKYHTMDTTTANPFEEMMSTLRGIENTLDILVQEKPAPVKVAPKEYYLTREEVSILLRVTRQTLSNYHKRGILKAVKIGRVYRYRKSIVDAFIASNS